MIGFVLELVKSARLDGLEGLDGLLLIAGIRSSLLARLFCIIIFVLVLFFLFLVFVYLLGRACAVVRTRNRDALGLESFLDVRKLFEERGKLLNVERDSLEPGLDLAMPNAHQLRREVHTFFPGSSSSSFS